MLVQLQGSKSLQVFTKRSFRHITRYPFQITRNTLPLTPLASKIAMSSGQHNMASTSESCKINALPSDPQPDSAVLKRKFEDDKDGDEADVAERAAPMSKNALRRLRKRREWEESKDERKEKRKARRHDRQDRKREERASLIAQGKDPSIVNRPRKGPSTLVPITFILDCDYEKYMSDKECISLASQVIRAYSDNRSARYRSHLIVSDFRDKISDRYQNILSDSHKNWKGITFKEEGFIECAAYAKQEMRENGGELIASLQPRDAIAKEPGKEQETTFLSTDLDVTPESEPSEELRDIVYLTSDSPNTLERLEPHTSYVIGGLVDRNREKGLCYKRAREKGVRTAKLPISDFMTMQTRRVLATNHVVGIMLKWLQSEDWADAFVSVIPKRKGALLKAVGTAGEAPPIEPTEKENKENEENEENEDHEEEDDDDDESVDVVLEGGMEETLGPESA